MMTPLLRFWLYIVFFTMMTFFFFGVITKSFAGETEDVGKWDGYIEFMGKPGTVRNLGQTDLFVPFMQDENDMSFFNLRGHIDDTENSEYNIGLGHRHIYDKWILGGYGYFDNLKNENGNRFQQLTFGVEALSEDWDFRLNSYFPRDKKKEVNRAPEVIIKNGKPVTKFFAERALRGLDFEVGRKIPLWGDTRLFIGGYNFTGGKGFESVTGPRARIETRLYDLPYVWEGSRLMIGLESQYDEKRGHQTSGLISFRVPLGTGSPTKPLKGLDRRMLEPVVRDADIVLGNGVVEAPALHPNGKAYTKTVYMDSSSTVEEVNTAMQTLTDKGEVPLLIMKQDAGNTPIEFGNKTINGGYSWLMAGKTNSVMSTNPFNGKKKFSAFVPSGKPPIQTILNNPTITTAINLMGDSHISAFEVTASAPNHHNTVGILNQIGTAYITDSTIRGGFRAGVISWGQGTKLDIRNTDFFDNSTPGNIVQYGAIVATYFGEIVADNVSIHNTNNNGITVDFDGELFITNSHITNTSGNGISAGRGGFISADNILIEKSAGIGVDSNRKSDGTGRLSKVVIKNSIIRNNMGSGLVSNDAILIADNLLISGNGEDGATLFGDFYPSLLKITNSRILNNGINDYNAQLYAGGPFATLIAENVILDGGFGLKAPPAVFMVSAGDGAQIQIKDSKLLYPWPEKGNAKYFDTFNMSTITQSSNTDEDGNLINW